MSIIMTHATGGADPPPPRPLIGPPRPLMPGGPPLMPPGPPRPLIGGPPPLIPPNPPPLKNIQKYILSLFLSNFSA